MQRPGRDGAQDGSTQGTDSVPGGCTSPDASGVVLARRIDEVGAAWGRAGSDTICGLIGSHALWHPHRTAVIDGALRIGYAPLLARANAIAGALSAQGVAPGSLVGVCVRRTWELVATLLGILRAGCAYVPLDPQYPRERVRYMLQHARAAAAIVDDADSAALCAGAPRLLMLPQIGADAQPIAAGPSATDLAYVIYTSGSTGQPKGVAVEHGSVVALVHAMRALLRDDELEGVLAAASICFDPSVMEILGTLCLGGTVVLADNVLALPELPSSHAVRTAIMVPSSMQALLAAGWRAEGIRCVVLGGEVLAPSLVARLHALDPRLRVFNVYGPTEDTVYSTAAEIRHGASAITIGTPVPGSRAYILDAAMHPAPVGMPGELYLAGSKLARGYLHDAQRTSQRFVDVPPNGPVPERRLYRTGDLCRWNADGQIEFIGRADHQIKLRGFRIELEEVESALAALPGVDAAAAAVVETAVGRKLLAGYVVTQDHTVPAAACAQLASRLPKYMVPQAVLRLDALPRLPNGKLDRAALPVPDLTRDPPDALAALPRRNAETDSASPSGADPVAGVQSAQRSLHGTSRPDRHAALLGIVRSELAQVLGIADPAQIAPHHAIQSLGLDSLDAVELSHRIGTALGRRLPASLVDSHPTAHAIADHLVHLSDGTSPEASPQASATRDALGPLQAELQSGHPPFLAAKAPAWSATDKAILVRAFKQLLGRQGRDPYGKFLRTGSAHAGTVADAHSGDEREAIIWTTNLYLGLNRDSGVMAAARAALDRFGTGMGTSATASGVTGLHLEFERAFASLTGKPAACLFPTGFTANLGAIAGLLGERDVVVMDQLCHASIVDGARLCGATIRTFRHNDPSDLAAILQAEASPYRTTLVVLEGVYSMGEGTAPVAEIVRTAKRYGALVLVDEAHSFGFYGPRGAGLCAEQGVSGEVDFIMTTLSKAMGSLGGVVAASEAHVALLKASSRAYVYQATSTPADIAAALAALQRLSTDDALRERLWDTTSYMRERFRAAGYDLGTGDGPIVTPHFADGDKLYAIARGLNARGIHTAAVTYPIVERGRGRLRFICSAAHTRAHVDATLEALVATEREVDTQRRAAADATHPDDPSAARATSGSDAAGVGMAADMPTPLEAWAHAFGAFVRSALAETLGAGPRLALSINISDRAETVMLLIDGARVAVNAAPEVDAARCCLTFADASAAHALHARDVQALLDGVLAGSCMLQGQTEPFVWFIGRMDQWRESLEA
jgi:amino acid adenylation domain-containing protein